MWVCAEVLFTLCGGEGGGGTSPEPAASAPLRFAKG